MNFLEIEEILSSCINRDEPVTPKIRELFKVPSWVSIVRGGSFDTNRWCIDVGDQCIFISTFGKDLTCGHVIRFEEHRNTGLCYYNENGPSRFELGESYVAAYYTIKGSRGYHRSVIEGPAKIVFCRKTKRIIKEEYFVNGQRHNSTGPASRSFDRYYTKWSNEFWLNGRQVSKLRFFSGDRNEI